MIKRRNVWLLLPLLITDYCKYVITQDMQTDERCLTETDKFVCVTPSCVYSASNIINNMDESIDPCHDFYKFACGGFHRRNTIPGDASMVSTFTIIQEKLLKQLKTLLEEPLTPTEQKPFIVLKRYYNVCMNTKTIDSNGLKVIGHLINKLGGWPVLHHSNWEEENFDWKESMYKLRKVGLPVNSIVTVYPGAYTYNSSLTIMNCDEARLSIDRQHLVKGFGDQFVKSYYDYVVDLAVMMGADKINALTELEDSVKFEISLAKITLAKEDRRNMSTLTNIMTVAELQKNFPVIPWMEYLQNLINEPSINITESEKVDVGVPKFLTELDILLKNTSKRTLANYIMSQFMISVVPYSTTEMRTRKLEFSRGFGGTAEMKPRWRECIQQAASSLKIALGSLYVRKYFNDSFRSHAETLVGYLREEFLQMLESVTWMDEITKKRAISKALKMNSHVGYPTEFLDDKKIEEYYKDLTSDTNDYMEFTLNILKFHTDNSYKELRKLVNQTDWTKQSSVTTVNAYYNSIENGIQLPAGILQDVFFDHNRPNYLNFGSMGFAIGHEITHGYDDVGRQYDEDGALSDWWEEITQDSFLKHAQCFIDQFSGYISSEVNLHINGVNTQGENIADNGGIKQAYLAYKTWETHNGVEPLLPGLNYTQQQLFWISMANLWCIKERNEYLIQEILSDGHPPSDIRVLGLISNSEYFGEDFNCELGSRMNPKQKCSVW